MKYFITLLTFLVLIFSCNTGNKTSVLSNPDDIIADQYVINVDKDTTLVTKNGALLKIPKGSVSTDKGNSVTLEIKEAYSIDQMILAGLTTQSNGEPLSSGGMIYINAAVGQNVTIKQAIKVAIPTNYLADSMNLYKGEKNEDATINWTTPQPLPDNEKINLIQQGQVLFQSKCQACHAMGKDATGPDLAHFPRREANNFSAEGGSYSFDFIRNPGEWIQHSLYLCNLKNRFGSMMTGFPDLTDNDLQSIYTYIQNESNRNELRYPAHAYLDSCIDSCYAYREKVGDLLYLRQQANKKRQDFIEDNGPMVKISPDSALAPPNERVNQRPVDFEETVSPENFNATYYQFTIESFGWFNIDILLKDLDGVKESELFVRIVGEYRERVQVFLIIPSVKVYGEGGPSQRNPDEYAFFYKSGKLPLPQNAKAYIMAVTENESSIAFALKEFTTGLQQQFDVSLQASTKKQFRAAIQNLNLDRLHIGVNDSKNAEAIRKTDTEIKNIDAEIKKAENLKPKNCDCDCRLQRPAADSTVVTEADYRYIKGD